MSAPSQRVLECVHASTIQVVSGRLERVICEDCGLVSVRYEVMISGEVERSKFSRRADKLPKHRVSSYMVGDLQ